MPFATSDDKAPLQLAYPGTMSSETEPLPTALQLKWAADRSFMSPCPDIAMAGEPMGELSHVAY